MAALVGAGLLVGVGQDNAGAEHDVEEGVVGGDDVLRPGEEGRTHIWKPRYFVKFVLIIIPMVVVVFPRVANDSSADYVLLILLRIVQSSVKYEPMADVHVVIATGAVHRTPSIVVRL